MDTTRGAPTFGEHGKALKKLREERKISQEALAAKAKMTRTTLAKYERGEGTKYEELKSIADALDVQLDLFLHGIKREIATAQLGIAPSPEAEQAALARSRHADYGPPAPRKTEDLAEIIVRLAPDDAGRRDLVEFLVKEAAGFAFRKGWNFPPR